MTAEIAILNQIAIAIAADSAVTIGRGRKIYNSALKVFALSKVAPVGIMIYGNAGLSNVPWETIIKVYRQDLGERRFETLAEYASDFIEYLPAQKKIFSDEVRADALRANIEAMLVFLQEEVISGVRTKLEQGPITRPRAVTSSIVGRLIERWHATISELERVPNITEAWESNLRAKVEPITQELIKKVWQKIPIHARQLTALTDICTMINTRQYMSDAHSGVVICGFGENEIFPSLITHFVDGVYEDKLKYKHVPGKSVTVSDGRACSIIPFAQDDMVTTFMEGINPSINDFARFYLRDVFSNLPKLIRDDDLAGSPAKKRNMRRSFTRAADKLLGKH